MLENPNIMTNLSAKDAVNMILSNDDLTKEREIYKIRVENELFENTLCKLLKELDSINGIKNRKRKVTDLFELCLSEKNILFHESIYDELKDCMYRKLINFAIDDSGVFAHEALYYLDKIYDIHVQAQHIPGTENDYVEFIEDLDGNTVWL